ncbi:MAG: hypothetical protein V3V99_05860 [candidate division Zixibacteria bacterium]
MKSLNNISVLAICIFMLISISWAGDENGPDSLIIEKFSFDENGKAVADFVIINDQDLAAVTIPMILRGEGVAIDSVSFAGGRFEYLQMLPVTVAENKLSVVFGAIVVTEEYVAPGRGLLAKMYLSSDTAKKDISCVIDTTTVEPATLMFTKTNSASFIPTFIKGTITVEEPAKE